MHRLIKVMYTKYVQNICDVYYIIIRKPAQTTGTIVFIYIYRIE